MLSLLLPADTQAVSSITDPLEPINPAAIAGRHRAAQPRDAAFRYPYAIAPRAAEIRIERLKDAAAAAVDSAPEVNDRATVAEDDRARPATLRRQVLRQPVRAVAGHSDAVGTRIGSGAFKNNVLQLNAATAPHNHALPNRRRRRRERLREYRANDLDIRSDDANQRQQRHAVARAQCEAVAALRGDLVRARQQFGHRRIAVFARRGIVTAWLKTSDVSLGMSTIWMPMPLVTRMSPLFAVVVNEVPTPVTFTDEPAVLMVPACARVDGDVARDGRRERIGHAHGNGIRAVVDAATRDDARLIAASDQIADGRDIEQTIGVTPSSLNLPPVKTIVVPLTVAVPSWTTAVPNRSGSQRCRRAARIPDSVRLGRTAFIRT